jgi:hypothetical protein
LDCSYNKLTSLPNGIKRLPKLEILITCGNLNLL